MQPASKRTSVIRVSPVLSCFFLISSVVFFAATEFFYLRDTRFDTGLVVREPERVLTDIVVGKTYEIDFPIHNPTAGGKRVFGGPFLT